VNIRVTGADIAARQAALHRYAAAHDRFNERELEHRAAGRTAEAEGAHRYALWCLRAYRDELDDRRPKGLA
jgi:hypothetical protein